MLASLPMAGALEGVKALGSVNFEKGRIVADGSMAFDSKEAEEELASFYTYVKPQKGSLLKYAPASTVAALGCGLNGSELYAMLSQMPGYGMLLANPMVKQVMDAFDGDLLLFSGMLPGGSYPVASLLAEVGDPSVVDQLVANLPGMPLVKTGEGAYTVSLGTLSAFFGVKDGVLYFTTDAAVKTALDGTKIDAMAGCNEVFAGQWSSFCFDFKGLNALLGNDPAGHVRPDGGMGCEGRRQGRGRDGGQGAQCAGDDLFDGGRIDPRGPATGVANGMRKRPPATEGRFSALWTECDGEDRIEGGAACGVRGRRAGGAALRNMAARGDLPPG